MRDCHGERLISGRLAESGNHAVDALWQRIVVDTLWRHVFRGMEQLSQKLLRVYLSCRKNDWALLACGSIPSSKIFSRERWMRACMPASSLSTILPPDLASSRAVHHARAEDYFRPFVVNLYRPPHALLSYTTTAGLSDTESKMVISKVQKIAGC